MAAKKTKNLIVGYGRKSKEEKGKNNLSISTQEELCKKYAEDKCCKFKYFSDVNKTGDNLNRPEFQKMLKYVKEHMNISLLKNWKSNIRNFLTSYQMLLRKKL